MGLKIVSKILEIRNLVRESRLKLKKIGLVPTMGALHPGHGKLIQEARQECDEVIVSIFVNPTQFGPNEDFERYPRTLAEDIELAQKAGATMIFHPSVDEIYPEIQKTWVTVDQLGDFLCGSSRPGHFRGVTTIVTKLFGIVQPDYAYFGAKDIQQARIIEQLTTDLNIAIEIKIIATVRENDGLAMSSRNRYLSPDDRAKASKIYQSILEVESLVEAGELRSDVLRETLTTRLKSIEGFKIDYVEVVDYHTLQPQRIIKQKTIVAVAIFLGGTRLIDNIVIDPIPSNSSLPSTWEGE